jgi:hypothetical protein
MNEEDKIIGGFGIDTQYERDYINYRPKIEYNNPNRNAGELSVDTDSQRAANDLEQINSPIAVSTWGMAVDILNDLDSVEQELSDKLKDITAKIPDKHLDTVREAAKKFGQDVDNTISFGLYKATFNYPESREAVLIQDIFEDFHSDVEGTLNAELYADVVEMKNDWLDMTNFIKRGLFLQIVSGEKLPTSISNEDDNLEYIHQAETEMVDNYLTAMKVDKENGDRYRELIIDAYESEAYFEAMKEYQDGERKTKLLEKRLHALWETGELIESKASSATKAIRLIKGTIDFKPYNEKEYDILYHILKQYSDKQKLTSGLKKVRAIIKLSVDHKKSAVNELKENARGIAGRKMKQKINNSLANGVHLRNEVSLDVHDLLEYFDGVPDNKGFEIVANHIATGLKQSNKVYFDQSSDFFKAHTMDAGLRDEKLKGLIDKDASRQIYRLLGETVKHVDDVGKWTDEAELSTWLDGFMENRK